MYNTTVPVTTPAYRSAAVGLGVSLYATAGSRQCSLLTYTTLYNGHVPLSETKTRADVADTYSNVLSAMRHR